MHRHTNRHSNNPTNTRSIPTAKSKSWPHIPGQIELNRNTLLGLPTPVTRQGRHGEAVNLARCSKQGASRLPRPGKGRTQVLRTSLVTEGIQVHTIPMTVKFLGFETEEGRRTERGISFSNSHALKPTQPSVTGKIQVLRASWLTEVVQAGEGSNERERDRIQQPTRPHATVPGEESGKRNKIS